MLFLIYLLSAVLVVNCVLLVLLVLIQLPKKDAGAGLAFGGAATDALFGAGSGNVLTKITKYATGAFFVVAFALATLQSAYHHRGESEFRRAYEQQSSQSPMQPLPIGNPPVTPNAAPMTREPQPAIPETPPATPPGDARSTPPAEP